MEKEAKLKGIPERMMKTPTGALRRCRGRKRNENRKAGMGCVRERWKGGALEGRLQRNEGAAKHSDLIPCSRHCTAIELSANRVQLHIISSHLISSLLFSSAAPTPLQRCSHIHRVVSEEHRQLFFAKRWQQQQQQQQIVHRVVVERFPQERLAKHLRLDARRLRFCISCQDSLAQLIIALHLVGRWIIGLCVGGAAILFGVSSKGERTFRRRLLRWEKPFTREAMERRSDGKGNGEDRLCGG